ncbi:MAG: class II glutamine amidotransferase [Sandaracinaceae bacterium]|nr:class II glutamine amidotransferase [Sandaracinaceae bacterium]
MCRFLLYAGRRVRLDELLYRPSSSLVRQAYDPQELGMLNLGGFGVAAWDPASPSPETPWLYRSTVLPSFDDNLRHLARKLEATCVLAHVRGIALDAEDGDFGPHNLHPFLYPGYAWSMAHNGFIRGFAAIRQDIVACFAPEVAAQVRGTTDSEAFYALVMSQLEDPLRDRDPDALVGALVRALRLLRRIRAARGLSLSTSMNVVFTNGRDAVVLRFVFDFGCYPLDKPGQIDPAAIRYLSLWYTLGDRFREDAGTWRMTGDSAAAASVLVASEPLTLDRAGWTEVPEYSILTVRATDGAHTVSTTPVDL